MNAHDIKRVHASKNAQIVVAVVTYRRPENVRALLPNLLGQVARSPAPAEILVVDNDPQAGARTAVLAVDGPVRYVHEPVPGISAARNRALDEAVGAKALVFIDDDERPDVNWLISLVHHWQETAATAVKGPTLFVFERPLSNWLTAGGFFDSPRMPTGMRLQEGGAGNMLLDMSWIQSHELRFDDNFGLSGGEDTLFTRQLVQQGGIIEWNDEAVDVELVPIARATPGWVLQRSLRQGNTWGRVVLRLAETPGKRLIWRLRLLVGGLARIMLGMVRSGIGTLIQNDVHQARGLRTVTRGIGLLLSACGHVHYEYGRVDN